MAKKAQKANGGKRKMKKSLQLSIITILLMFVVTACGERSRCDEDCDCIAKSEVSVEQNSEVEAEIEKETESENSVKETKTSSYHQHEKGSRFNPIVQIESNDPIVIAEEYVRLYNTDQWTGYPTDYKEFHISTHRGEIEINGEGTGVYTDERLYCDEVRELYMSGKWDGKSMEYKEHTVSLSSSGELLVDGYLTSCFSQETLDFPENFHIEGLNIHGILYIPTQGTYFIANGILTKYLRGEEVKLEGTKLKWKGFDVGSVDMVNCSTDKYVNYVFNVAELAYDVEQDTLYLVTYSLKNDTGYLYVFPDYNVSEIKFLGEISHSSMIRDGFAFATSELIN